MSEIYKNNRFKNAKNIIVKIQTSIVYTDV